MIRSLRITVLLPLIVASLIVATISSLVLLEHIEQRVVSSMAAQIDQASVLLGPSIAYTPPTRLPYDRSDQTLPPSFLAWFGPDSSRIYPISPIADEQLPATIGDIHPPGDFRAVQVVGRIIHAAGLSDTAATGHVVAVLLSTQAFQRAYAESRFLVQVLSIAGVILISLTGFLLARKLNQRVETLRSQVAGTRTVSPQTVQKNPHDVFSELTEDILGAQKRIADSKQEIARLQVVRSQFLANVSHEVRTPLFSLKGFLETLLDGGIDDPEVNRAFLGKALHHAQRIDNLLRDLIDIARIESGEMRMSFRYFNLTALLQQVREDHVDIAEARNQSLVVRGSAIDVEVMGDKDRLRQALSNLIDNAVKYSPEGSTVTLSVDVKPASVTVSVSDNGPGIPREHVPRIFERFYRIDAERSREMGGTGLGLAIVKHIVEAHGTDIRVESTQGRGTAFSFTLRR